MNAQRNQPKPSYQPMKVVSPDQNDAAAAFLREVDEALQYERLMNLWHRYKVAIVAGVAVVLLAVAAGQAWQAYKAHQARTLAERWHAVTAITDEANRKVQVGNFAKTSQGGYKALALFTQAQAAQKPADVAAAYRSVAEDKSQAPWLQNLARFNLALTLLGTDDTTAKSQLELLTQEGKQTTATYAPALEQLSILAQRQGDTLAARGYTEKIVQLDPQTVPPDLRQRALQRLGALSSIAH